MNRKRLWLLALIGLPLVGGGALASDHGDTPLLVSMPRHDARITDLFAFLQGSDLVLILNSNPAIPRSAADYTFPADLMLAIHIDNDSDVRFDDPQDLATYGGTIVRPGEIKEDITLRFRFDTGRPVLQASGLPRQMMDGWTMFTGLRDDPFIRGPQIGRNIAAIVLQLPLRDVIDGQSTLLLWATSKVGVVEGPFQDMAGRSLRSQLPVNDLMNTLRPREHWTKLGLTPDVMIFDTSRPAAFPNGRLLTDDVVDLVGVPGVLATDAPFPSENDVPFLAGFPYLAPPHAPN